MIEKFKQYLTDEKKFTVHTIKSYCYDVTKFKQWLLSECIMVETLTYCQLLTYIKFRRAKGDKRMYINHSLIALRHYFDFLISKQVIQDNPASNFYLRGVKKTVPHELLEKQELNHLYEKYAVFDDRSHRNKVILGLLVYQGLSASEIKSLKAQDFTLEKAQVKINDSIRSNGRCLPLESEQIPLLAMYISSIRTHILEQNHANDTVGINNQLFVGMQGSKDLRASILLLMKELKKDNIKVRNVPHLRMSVITEWLKSKDVRHVQYLAGHKYVSSTERYQLSHLEVLLQQLTKFHPCNPTQTI